MTAVTFDTHLFIKNLRENGFTEPQAEAIVRVTTKAREVDAQSLVTDTDLVGETKLIRSEMREMELRLQSLIKDVTIRLGGMIMALGGILIAIKYFG